MKLKEIPAYLRRANTLQKMSLENLKSNSASNNEQGLLISLTSIEHRLPKIYLVIRSLLSQTLKAEKIVLWLHHDLAENLPPSLTELVGPSFQIAFTDEYSPHRKLTETLRRYPDNIIVTCDDDMLYPSDWLDRLVSTHKKHPDDIIAHECRKILKTNSGAIRPYIEWVKEDPGTSSNDTISIGYGGVLYPIGCLPAMALDKDYYLRLSPKADDLWFKAMSLSSGTQIRRSHLCEPMPIQILGSQKVALKHKNIKEDLNRAQWIHLIKEFGISI